MAVIQLQITNLCVVDFTPSLGHFALIKSINREREISVSSVYLTEGS